MLNKVLIANRGEIACRIISTAQRLGIATVAVYSDADRQARHVKMADEAVYIGASPSAESYLVVDKIIAAAKQTGAQAIHPGYGFLSENESFADACADNNLIFVGPPVNAIAAMGSKSAAKAIMGEADVPLVPGYHGSEQDPEFLAQEAEKIGFPVLLKAAYGGGGKGMRIVEAANEFHDALASAKREAKASFNNDRMLIEKFIRHPRHVEIQVFADEHGNAVYLAERDCSVQRRHQKVVEEAPAPAVTEATRIAMGEAAVRAAQAIDYVGAGTVEFLLDRDNNFYFMEMNTRLQVEHPVTEMITGLDLVEWQLRVADGEPLPLAQDDVKIHGHAFEARIYAEDPDNEFLPCTGVLKHLRPPETGEHVRVDTGVLEGDEVTAFYDPMIAKLIVWGEDRNIALRRLNRALDAYRIAGLRTNIDFLRRICRHPQFQQAELSTQFIEHHEDTLFADKGAAQADDAAVAALAIIAGLQKPTSSNPWQSGSALRLNQPATYQFSLQTTTSDEPFQVTFYQNSATQPGIWIEQRDDTEYHWQVSSADDQLTVTRNGAQRKLFAHVDSHSVTLFDQHATLSFQRERIADTLNEDTAQGSLTAPMNGTVIEVLVKSGDTVEKDQAVLIMEAMKMEYTIRAPHAGEVTDTYYSAGDLVSDGAELLTIVAAEEAEA